MKNTLLNIYDKQYKKLMALSFFILLLSLASLGMTYAKTGEFFAQSVSLKGGITLTTPIIEQVNPTEIQSALLLANPNADITVRAITEAGTQKALIIEAADITPEDLTSSITNVGIPLTDGDYSIETMGSSLGSQFFKQTIKALALAFIAMSLVVFLTFRNFLPSLFIILSTVSDIASTLAVVNILGIKISTAGIAAFLMLIGYAVDNNILLTTKVLKRKGEGGTTFERLIASNKTGMLMTITALTASLIGLVFTQSETIHQIMIIITIGLLFDIIYTYFQNAGILRWYMEKHHGGN
ncbi:MMPL family transporter [Candidatus Woesearchaeota archaeon]|nr:MMPL family transporter [Candidatus Woesearchaeota archaeon]